jgi:hypothetical protein
VKITDLLTVPRYNRTILAALQDKPVYQGTAPAKEKARRRAASKAARAARRSNR